jgi:hypothetical protein
MFIGTPPFGYACTDDREGDKCAFWHPPDISPFGMQYHESSYSRSVPQKRRQPSHVPKSRSDGIKAVDTIPCLFSSPKLSPDFVKHFSEPPNTCAIALDNDLEGLHASAGKIPLMAVDSSPPAGRLLEHICGDTAEHLAGKLSEGNRKTLQPLLAAICDDGEDNKLLLCSHASPATSLAGYLDLNTFARCLIVVAFLSGCLLITHGWYGTGSHLLVTVYLLEIVARTWAFVRDGRLRKSESLTVH